MTKTLSVQLGGLLFQIDEQALAYLEDYINAIEKQFLEEEGCAEIMQDIENRMAELLTEKMDRHRDFIGTKDVDYLIGILGQPNDFSPINDVPEGDDQMSGVKKTISKRLYRDPDHRLLGGVCSGLAAYFDSDPWIFRVIFIGISFFFLTGLLVYAIIWLVVPEAVTSTQKLEMKGEPVTIESIKNAVKEEFEQVKQRMNWK
ncbi:MAG: PspC domain-containing protein [Salinivirgaceae bacterium]|nr:PspC domain-containing protein [Salinivirgaceae bacterium]